LVVGKACQMDQQVLLEVSRKFGTPCYVYFWDHVVGRVESLRSAFGESIRVSYAVKANPNRALLRRLRDRVDHLDISSGGEFLVASEAGHDAASFTFVGPAKADWELHLAAQRGCGCFVVESDEELSRLNCLGSRVQKVLPVAVRVNPAHLPKGYGVSMAMRATQFGIDEECLDPVLERLAGLEHIRLEGFHVYAGTQCLNNDSIAENLENCARIFLETSRRHDTYPRRLIFGTGFGIPYHDRDRPISLQSIAARTKPVFDRLRQDSHTGDAEISFELGRYLVGEAGFYLVTVLAKKSTRGREILLLDGGMNHHLAASGNLGGVIKRNYPVRRITPGADGAETKRYDLAGNLCTNVDTLGRDVELSPCDRGDVLAFGGSGAYGLTASPVHFISHRPPKEIAVAGCNGKAVFTDVTADGTLAAPPAWPDGV